MLPYLLVGQVQVPLNYVRVPNLETHASEYASDSPARQVSGSSLPRILLFWSLVPCQVPPSAHTHPPRRVDSQTPSIQRFPPPSRGIGARITHLQSALSEELRQTVASVAVDTLLSSPYHLAAVDGVSGRAIA